MQLLQLWTLLQPDNPLLKRVTKQWQTIGTMIVKQKDKTFNKLLTAGFQGEDPKTDFRGMGMLGLSNLV